MPSSVIDRAEYNAEQKFLDIKYRSGKIYRYLDVPEDEYQAYRNSFSKGKYLNQFIKTSYEFMRLN